jgi:putative glutamine amidotransferase
MAKTRVGITSGWEQGTLVEGWPLIYTIKSCVDVVEKAGGIPLVLPVMSQTASSIEALNVIDAVIISGEVLSIKRDVLANKNARDLESQNPLRYANERDYIKSALERGIPLLGICRGHQVLNVVCGGSLYLDDSHLQQLDNAVTHQQGSKRPEETIHSITTDGILAKILGKKEIMVNSFHRQMVKEPPPGFDVVARSKDGMIEAIASTEHDFVLGLQFHPEVMSDPIWLNVFKSLIEAGNRYSNKKTHEGCVRKI